MFLCLLAELGMAFQFKKPERFFSTVLVIAGAGFIIARIIILINMLGMLVFAVSVFRGNIKGRLVVSYFIMMIHSVAMIIMAIAPRQYEAALAKNELEMNSLLFLITMLLSIFVFLVFILREKGVIRVLPKFSSVVLLVIIGQFVLNGLFMSKGVLISGPVYLVYGFISVLPYIAIFVFERFVLEPTMMEYR